MEEKKYQVTTSKIKLFTWFAWIFDSVVLQNKKKQNIQATLSTPIKLNHEHSYVLAKIVFLFRCFWELLFNTITMKTIKSNDWEALACILYIILVLTNFKFTV